MPDFHSNGSLYDDVSFRPPDEAANRLLQEIAAKHNAPLALLQSLLDLESEKVHLNKRRNVKEQIRQLVEEHLENNPRASGEGAQDLI